METNEEVEGSKLLLGEIGELHSSWQFEKPVLPQCREVKQHFINNQVCAEGKKKIRNPDSENCLLPVKRNESFKGDFSVITVESSKTCSLLIIFFALLIRPLIKQ